MGYVDGDMVTFNADMVLNAHKCPLVGGGRDCGIWFNDSATDPSWPKPHDTLGPIPGPPPFNGKPGANTCPPEVLAAFLGSDLTYDVDILGKTMKFGPGQQLTCTTETGSCGVSNCLVQRRFFCGGTATATTPDGCSWIVDAFAFPNQGGTIKGGKVFITARTTCAARMDPGCALVIL